MYISQLSILQPLLLFKEALVLGLPLFMPPQLTFMTIKNLAGVLILL